ncbi:TfoX/Sxy family protein [Gordonia sp. X0973]|uniref:TfoX/Sxy family protein n=1 Tax=Gordonia sp. X0973 TaxID=2742602 RepID=UPI000F544B24|nr:TfoX/Sxy family protein [Gordonia sp. X0973]QKT06355.1 TfoX/Sxy family protein [Gordonia sp. X0973]
MASREELAGRLREMLREEPVTREISMFGGRAFMVDEKMACCAMKNGDLLLRVAADEHAELVTRAGAEQAQMGAGREMGPGWIIVSATVLGDDSELEPWVEKALEYNREATGRG